MESYIIALAVGTLLLCAASIILMYRIVSLENEVRDLEDKIREEYYQNNMRFMDLEQRIQLCKMSSGKNKERE